MESRFTNPSPRESLGQFARGAGPGARVLEFGSGRQDVVELLPELMPEIVRWTNEIRALARTAGRRLSHWQLQDARQMGVRSLARVRLIYVDSLPQPANDRLRAALRRTGFLIPDSRGLALGHAVLIRRECAGDRRVLRHRLRQVAQAEALGSAEVFVATYLRQVARFGRDLAPLALSESAREA